LASTLPNQLLKALPLGILQSQTNKSLLMPH